MLETIKGMVISRQRRVYKEICDSYGFLPTHGHCIYHAIAGIKAAQDYGYRFSIVGGTLQWKYRERPFSEESDCFGYEWEPKHLLSIKAVKEGKLPEIHIWIEYEKPDLTKQVIDFSISLLPEACPYTWENRKPPIHLWEDLNPDPRLTPIPQLTPQLKPQLTHTSPNNLHTYLYQWNKEATAYATEKAYQIMKELNYPIPI